MEKWNPENVEKIWQRVQSSHTPPTTQPDLCGLIARERTMAGLYTVLAHKYPLVTGKQLQYFARQSLSHIASIKGICALTGQTCPPAPPSTRQNDPVHILLRRCYGMAAQSHAEYESLSARADIGNVFRQLAWESQRQMTFLLQLLGTAKSH